MVGMLLLLACCSAGAAAGDNDPAPVMAAVCVDRVPGKDPTSAAAAVAAEEAATAAAAVAAGLYAATTWPYRAVADVILALGHAHAGLPAWARVMLLSSVQIWLRLLVSTRAVAACTSDGGGNNSSGGGNGGSSRLQTFHVIKRQ